MQIKENRERRRQQRAIKLRRGGRSKNLVVAVDAMGTEGGIDVVFESIARYVSLHKSESVKFLLFGRGDALEEGLSRWEQVRGVCEVRECETVVASTDDPLRVLRSEGRKSSMWGTLKAVKDGEAIAAVSAGNTGAMVAMGKVLLGTLPGVERQALVALGPTPEWGKFTLLLDVGASVDVVPLWLAQYAVMGAVFAEILHGQPNPKVALVNVGEELLKGGAVRQEAANILSKTNINFVGYVEGDDLLTGEVQVAVMDGFTGNVVLKFGEGVMSYAYTMFEKIMRSNWRTKLAYVIGRKEFRQLRDFIHPAEQAGGFFVGLNGCVVKSHGSAGADGFSSSLEHALLLARLDVVGKMADSLEDLAKVVARESGVQRREVAN